MRQAWRVADIRAAEAGLLATVGEGTLMQRAAAGLARRCAVLLADRYGGVYGRSVVLLVGAGNNGGDALYAGASLARRGVRVTALALTARVHPGGAAALQAAGGRLIEAAGGRVVEAAGGRVVEDLPDAVDLVVDGILGIGGRGGLTAAAAATFRRAATARAVNGYPPTVVAVDVPSGIGVDTGAVVGEAVQADVTVTFGALKAGLLVGPAVRRAGVIEVVDIGLGPWLRADPVLRAPERADVARWWPQPGPDDDKYTRGVVGVATGSSRYPGAAVLSVGGALAGPAGLVRYAGAAASQVRDQHPSVIATDRVAQAGRVQAWVCGSGLGTDARAEADLRTVLAADVPVCLDADALTLLVGGSMADLLRHRTAPTVLTPHDREFARLAGGGPGEDRVEAALSLAAKTNATVLLKGDRTIVGTPDGQAFVNPTGSSALATGGTGDVLAGLLGALLAAGLPPEQAALAAAYVHGLAGGHAATGGPVTAADVVAALRPVIAGLGSAAELGGPGAP